MAGRSVTWRVTRMLLCMTVVGTACFCPVAMAGTVYSNFGPGTSFSHSNVWAIGTGSSPSLNLGIAMAFTPGQNDTLSAIHIALGLEQGPNSVTVALAADSGGLPGGILESWTFTNLPPAFTNTVPLTAISSLNPSLNAGTQYWVTVVSTSSTSAGWNMNTTGDLVGTNGIVSASDNGGASWFNTKDPTGTFLRGAFDVIGTSSTQAPPSCSVSGPAGLTTDYTDPAAFAAATANPTKVGFANILPPGALFGGYSQLDVPGFSFSTPLPGTFVNITTAAYYSPQVYPQDFIVDSTVQGTGLPNPNNQLCVTLGAPAFAVALDLGGLGFSGLGSGTITLSNGHTFSIPTLPTVGNTTFVGFVSTVPITNLTFATLNDSWVVEDVITATPTVNNCSLSLAPTAASFPARGGGGSFQVNTGAGCTWDATFNAPWIVPPIHNNVAIVGGFPPPAGPGGVRFWVTANPTTSARTGTISVGNQTFAVNQAGLSCSASINPSSATVSASGGSIRVVVDDGPSCSWSAASNVGWLTVTLGGAGTGNASVYIQASANTGGARTGTVTIAGQTLTVQQSAQSAPAQNACGAMDVTAQVNISHGQLRPDFISPNIWYLDITLTARPGAVPSAPAWLVLRGVPNHQPSPFDVTDNATYTTTCFDKGSGMFPIGTLQQGPVQLTVTFYVGNAAYPPPYNPIVLSGTPTR